MVIHGSETSTIYSCECHMKLCAKRTNMGKIGFLAEGTLRRELNWINSRSIPGSWQLLESLNADEFSEAMIISETSSRNKGPLASSNHSASCPESSLSTSDSESPTQSQ